MNIIDIINKKRQGLVLSLDELTYVIEGYTTKQIPDYQMSALLMAITIRGLTDEETSQLTALLQRSGESFDFGKERAKYVDKHSTGGIGDKATLILGPLSAALGLKMLKMSGASLGYTGGTVDKLKSIPHMRLELTSDEIKAQLARVGTVLISQSKYIAPADKALYALRDVTGTVDSLPLIASSIMGKKLASGAQHILLDIKCGDGAFMKSLSQARALGHLMIKLGASAMRNVQVEITQMNEPLGRAVGNRLEVQEALAFLSDYESASEDLKTLILSSAAKLLIMAQPSTSQVEAKDKVIKALTSHAALGKFQAIVESQGGDWQSITNQQGAWSKASYQQDVIAPTSGYVKIKGALPFGEAQMMLGGLRANLVDEVDDVAGVYIYKKTGEYVQKGEKLCTLQSSKPISEATVKLVVSAFELQARASQRKMILDTF